MAIAAIYARKSTEQNGVADEQKSVARQVDHARQYAARKGWTVARRSTSTSTTASAAPSSRTGPGFLRLMNALKPRAPFQVLVMSEESRLGREAIETAYALKQLVQAGVRVFFYLEDRERTLDSPTDKIMLSLTAFADELEREKARQRTYDAMLRKAQAGHVTGGRVFGYDNVEVADARRASGRTSSGGSTRRRPRSCGGSSSCARTGAGLTRIAKTLNAEGAPAPRAQQGRPAAGPAAASARSCSGRSTAARSCGTRRGSGTPGGCAQRADRPAGDWLRVPAPELRIVSDDAVGRGARATSRRGSTEARRQATRRRDHRTRIAVSAVGVRAVRAVRRRVRGRAVGSHGGQRAYVLRLHVVLEARREGLREQPGRPDGRDRRRSAGDAGGRRLPAGGRRGGDPAGARGAGTGASRRRHARSDSSAELRDGRAGVCAAGGRDRPRRPLDAVCRAAADASGAARRRWRRQLAARAGGVTPSQLARRWSSGYGRSSRTGAGCCGGTSPTGAAVLRKLLIGPLRFTPVHDGRRRGYALRRDDRARSIARGSSRVAT